MTLLDPADHALLAEVLQATREPFRDPVRVGGALIPRRLARHIERNLLKLRSAERRLAATAAGALVRRPQAGCPLSTVAE